MEQRMGRGATGGRASAGWPLRITVVVAVVLQKAAFYGLLTRTTHAPLLGSLYRWDSLWYLEIAGGGYHYPAFDAAGLPRNSDLAFFPLYPGAGRLLSLTGLDLSTSLLAVALVGTVAAVLGLLELGTELANPLVGTVLAGLWTVLPRSFIQAMPYSESVFTAFSVWSLVALARGRWWRAAVLCALAGATRPSGSATVVTVGGALLVVLWHAARRSAGESGPVSLSWSGRPVSIPSQWSVVGAGILSATGLAGAIGHVIWRTGRWDGYLVVQQQWGMQIGSPVTTYRLWWQELLAHRSPALWARHEVAFALPVWTVLLVAAIWVVVRRPVWRPAVAMSGVLWLLMASAQSYFNSRERFLLPAVGCLVPLALVAEAMARRRGPTTRVLLVLAWLVLSAVQAWWGVHVLLHANQSP